MAIRPTFMGFETASRGIMLNQKALDIVANNVGNIGVTGYTRQRVDQVSMEINHRNTRYHTKTALMGQGAGIYGISQIRDKFLDKRFREENADVGYYQTSSEILEDMTAALDEIDPEQMNKALGKLQKAWNELMKEGSNSEIAAAEIMSASRGVTQVLQQLDAKINNIWGQQHYNLGLDVNDVNGLLREIAQYNDDIRKEMMALDYSNGGYYGPNELMDKRNVLIDALSAYSDVLVTDNGDGTVDITMGGHKAVQKLEYDQINLQDGQSAQTIKVSWASDSSSAVVNGGKLRAYYDMLNGAGQELRADRGETDFPGIRYYKNKIDKMATTMAEAFNTAIPVLDEQGNPIQGQYKTLFVDSELIKTPGVDPATAYPLGAGTMIINPQWAADASYAFDFIDRNEVLDEGRSGEWDTTFAEKIISFFDESQAQLNFGEFQGSFSSYVTYYSVTLLGVQKSDVDVRLESQTDIIENLKQRIAAISGVNMEEEAKDTMMYTKAYNAMARVLTALDDALDRLINNTGRVGL